MVNLTGILLARRRFPMYRKPDGFWRKRQVLKLSAHFYGRARNCFSLAIRRLQRSLMYVATGRQLRKKNMKLLWENRLDAGCHEFGYLPEGSKTLLEGLARSDVLLNRQTLANLAVWEPRTFEAINKISASKAREERFSRYLGHFPKGIMGKL